MKASQLRPTVEVIVLNWNGGAYLPDCLAALMRQDYPNTVVTIVDNGSTDGSVDWVRTHVPGVRIVENHANLGFAAGNNVALRASTADIIALLNPDVVPSPTWLSQLVNALDQDDRVGIVGSKLWYPDGRTIQHGGGYLQSPQAMPGHYAIGETDTGQANERRPVDYVIGAALGLRREVSQEIGFLDEGFFLYYEDVDYCERASKAGWRVLYAPEATAVHVESATAVKDSFSYLQRFHTGRWRYLLKHSPVDTLLEESVTAESQWLERIDLQERLASVLAYQAMITGWDEVLMARERQGAGTLTADAAALVRAKLVWLRDVAQAGNNFPHAAEDSSLEPTPEQAFGNALAALSGASSQLQGESGAGILDVIAGIDESASKAHENHLYLSQVQMKYESILTDTHQLRQSAVELRQQIEELEKRLAAIVQRPASSGA